jgi:hypothetical protein
MHYLRPAAADAGFERQNIEHQAAQQQRAKFA